MTQDSLAAAHTAGKRVALLAGMIISLTLTACGGGDSLTGGDLNQPLDQPKIASIAFAPIIAAPPAISTKMVNALTAAAKQKNIPVVDPKDADYSVMGLMQAGKETRGSRVTYIGDITDKTGKRVKRIQGDEIVSPKKSGDPWALVDDAALDRVAAKAATDLHAWLTGAKTPEAAAVAGGQPTSGQSKPVSSTASLTPAPAQPRPLATPVRATPAKPDMTVYVQSVSGAPGDGQTSLTAAMRKHLASQGVRVTETKSPNGYTVQGNVEMGAAQDGKQPIKISWQVVDPSGKPVSNVVQRNQVDQNSLDVTWGPTADAAAEAASVEVAKIVPRPTT